MNTGYRVAAAALMMTATLATAGCGASQQELDAARQAGVADASRSAAEEKAKVDKAKLEKDVADLKAQQEKLQAQASAKATATTTPTSQSGGGSGGGGGGSSCGGGISVNSVTTCTFAHTVVADWRSSGGGNASFWSYSPVTGKNYWMSCSAGTTTVCRGGNNAVVYIR